MTLNFNYNKWLQIGFGIDFSLLNRYNAAKPENSGEKIETEGVPGRKFMPLATATICAMDGQHFTQTAQVAQFTSNAPASSLLASGNIIDQFSFLFNYLSFRPMRTSLRYHISNLGVDSLY